MTMLTDALRRIQEACEFVVSQDRGLVSAGGPDVPSGRGAMCDPDDKDTGGAQSAPNSWPRPAAAVPNVAGSVIGFVNTIAPGRRRSLARLRLLRQLANRLAAVHSGKLLVADMQQDTDATSCSRCASVGKLRQTVLEKIRRPIVLADRVRATSHPSVFQAPELAGLCGRSENLAPMIRFLGDCRRKFDVSLISMDAIDLAKSRELLQRCDGVYILFASGHASIADLRRYVQELSRMRAAFRGGLVMQQSGIQIPIAA